MLDKFKQYLLQTGTIKSHYVPYYLKWVADCYGFLDTSDSTFISSDQKRQFLVHMAKSYEEWQVKQADTAPGDASFKATRLVDLTKSSTPSGEPKWALPPVDITWLGPAGIVTVKQNRWTIYVYRLLSGG